MKNEHSKDDTFHTLLKLKILRANVYYESDTLKLI